VDVGVGLGGVAVGAVVGVGVAEGMPLATPQKPLFRE
jgi:hypothetical protein